jgi:hypothetical protein
MSDSFDVWEFRTVQQSTPSVINRQLKLLWPDSFIPFSQPKNSYSQGISSHIVTNGSVSLIFIQHSLSGSLEINTGAGQSALTIAAASLALPSKHCLKRQSSKLSTIVSADWIALLLMSRAVQRI